MDSMIRRRFETQVHVCQWCEGNRALVDRTPLGMESLAKLIAAKMRATGVLAELSKGREAAKSGAVSRRRARTALRSTVRKIVRSGRFLNLPEVSAAQFREPDHGSDQQLVADSKDIAGRALPLADAFARCGLAASVLEALPAQIAAVEQSIAEQTAGRDVRHAARLAILTALDEGSAAIDALEAVILNTPDVHEDTVAAWKRVRFIGPRATEEPEEADPAASPTPTPPADPAKKVA